MGTRLGLLVVLLSATLSWDTSAQVPQPLSTPAPVTRAEVSALLKEEAEQTRRQLAAIRPSIWTQALPAIAAIVGALSASLAAFLLQRSRLSFDRESAFHRAGVDALSEIKNFRSRQLNEFYTPLQAMLKQSHVLRDELYRRLLAAPPQGVSIEIRSEEEAFSGKSLYIKHPNENFRPFRLIHEMSFIQQQCPNLVPNVVAIVSVNKHIAKLLHDKIGLVRSESTELSGVLGQFLAHGRILEEVVSAARQGNSKVAPQDYTTAFPRRLNALVAADCEWLRNDIADWERQATVWMEQFKTSMNYGNSTTYSARPE